MSTYPLITNERPREYSMDTRLYYDYEQVSVVFSKTDWSVSVANLSEVAEVLGATILAPDGTIAPPVQQLTVPEALRVLADDIEYAVAELGKPEY